MLLDRWNEQENYSKIITAILILIKSFNLEKVKSQNRR